MKDGVIQQFDTPQNLYDTPCNLFVAGFIGSPQMNFRPEDFHAEPQFFGEGNEIDAYIDLDEMMGSESYLYLNYAGQKLVTRVPARYAKKAEENIKLAIDTEKLHVFDKDTELTICQ